MMPSPDPAGKLIAKKNETRLRGHAPEAQTHFTRLAVNLAQIRSFDPPARPPKASEVAAGEITPAEAAELSKIVEAFVRRSRQASLISGFGLLRQRTHEAAAPIMLIINSPTAYSASISAGPPASVRRSSTPVTWSGGAGWTTTF